MEAGVCLHTLAKRTFHQLVESVWFIFQSKWNVLLKLDYLHLAQVKIHESQYLQQYMHKTQNCKNMFETNSKVMNDDLMKMNHHQTKHPQSSWTVSLASTGMWVTIVINHCTAGARWASPFNAKSLHISNSNQQSMNSLPIGRFNQICHDETAMLVAPVGASQNGGHMPVVVQHQC